MNYFITLFLKSISLLSDLSLFIGIFISFFGNKIMKIISIFISFILGFLIGASIGIFIFNSNIMFYILSVTLSIIFLFFTIVYYKYIKYIFVPILGILFLLYFSYFILVPINIIKTYIFLYLFIIFTILLLSYKFNYIITIVITSFTGTIMILSNFLSNNSIFLKIIAFIIFSCICILFQIFSFKIFKRIQNK